MTCRSLAALALSIVLPAQLAHASSKNIARPLLKAFSRPSLAKLLITTRALTEQTAKSLDHYVGSRFPSMEGVVAGLIAGGYTNTVSKQGNGIMVWGERDGAAGRSLTRQLLIFDNNLHDNRSVKAGNKRASAHRRQSRSWLARTEGVLEETVTHSDDGYTRFQVKRNDRYVKLFGWALRIGREKRSRPANGSLTLANEVMDADFIELERGRSGP